MSYEPTVWKTGDIVTSEKLNKLENAVANVGGGSDIFHITIADSTLDKTWQEVFDAMHSEKLCLAWKNDESEARMFVAYEAYQIEGTYSIKIGDTDSSTDYITQSADGYPEAELA